ncbi:enoyl-CoA delta isomerase 2 [Musca domestica]|uniref:Enoyl-CoA delta isomerase 2 n=1 Tax=Musca domestica TaxID=7370 RepID=A0A9J7DGV2_MUSDO|nr:enoyl-CoA delta isomerase 2 [Musca domestica]XP_058978219.1 enoyl-CoA delta isomerase 2 [Musca domestica]
MAKLQDPTSMEDIRRRDRDSRISNKTRKSEILKELRGNILVLKINRLASRNALNRNAVYDLIAAIGEATHNKDVKMILLTGCGDYFCSGTDLKQLQEYRDPEDYFYGANYILRSLIKTLIACPKIIVCLINGPCIGIGFTLAALCDICVCTKGAFFQTPFSQLGLCAEACSSYTFSQHFGQSWASKLLLFGEKLSAEKAEQLGFVTRIYEDLNDVEARLWPKLQEYSQLPWESVKISKNLMRLNQREQLFKALEAELKEIDRLRRGPVYQKAVADFLQKSKSKL